MRLTENVLRSLIREALTQYDGYAVGGLSQLMQEFDIPLGKQKNIRRELHISFLKSSNPLDIEYDVSSKCGLSDVSQDFYSKAANLFKEADNIQKTAANRDKTLVEIFGIGGNKEEIKSLEDIETVGDLKSVIAAAIAAKKKGAMADAAVTGIKDAVVDELTGKIPGASLVKGLFGVAKAAYSLDDNVKIGKGLSALNVDDEIAAIVDDAVENRFLKDMESELEGMSDDRPLSDVNMTTALSKFLGKEFKARTVDGFPTS